MSDTDTEEELEDVRERKLEELRKRAEGAQGAGGVAGANGAAEAAPDEPIEVESREEYEQLVAEYDVALVDFYADWCGPCKMLAPAVEELAAETSAAVLKVDIDVLQGLARDMGVQGVPTLVVYSGGEVDERVVGVQEKHVLQSLIESAS